MALFWVISLAHPNQTWYVENGHLVSGLIRRMPYEQVFLWLNMLSWMLSCRDKVTVLEPGSIREKLYQITSEIAKRYEGREGCGEIKGS